MAKDKTGFKTKLTKSRDTKGTYVYKNEEDNSPIPSLYIKKSAFKGDAPEAITVSIEEA